MLIITQRAYCLKVVIIIDYYYTATGGSKGAELWRNQVRVIPGRGKFVLLFFVLSPLSHSQHF